VRVYRPLIILSPRTRRGVSRLQLTVLRHTG
jgi:hypothetical protein